MNITVFRDYKEEGWESMEVYADQLSRHLSGALKPGDTLRQQVTLPAASRLLAARSKLIRYVFRFGVNPAGSLFVRSDVNHIIDQANSHLLAALPLEKTVITVHDLIVPFWREAHVDMTSWKRRLKLIGEHWRINYLRKAYHVIAVSEATKSDLIATLHIQPERITVIPEGVDKAFIPIPSDTEKLSIRRKLKLPERFILHVGTTHEYKNISGLLRIFRDLVRTDSKLFLVKVGMDFLPSDREYCRRFGLESRIIRCGRVESRDLPLYYGCALALVHPSLTEGFGFTVLEAMASGCPVVVSDIPALRELVGNAGAYIKTDQTSKAVLTVHQILASGSQRQRMIQKGLTRAALFTWAKTAEKTYAVYRQIYREG